MMRLMAMKMMMMMAMMRLRYLIAIDGIALWLEQSKLMYGQAAAAPDWNVKVLQISAGQIENFNNKNLSLTL